MRSVIGLAALCGLITLGLAASAQSPGGLRFTAPTGEAAYAPGDTAQLRWAGGDPSWRMRLDIIDVAKWAVVNGTVIENAPNSGASPMHIPSNLACGQRYQFYIEEMGKAAWSYGGTFTVSCDNDEGQPAPAQPGASPVDNGAPDDVDRYCGRIHNETYNINDNLELDVNRGGGFDGRLIIGASLYGSDKFQGSLNGATCQGSTGRLQFQASCSGGHITARYTIDGQVGSFDVVKGTCPDRAAAPPPNGQQPQGPGQGPMSGPGPRAPGQPGAPAYPSPNAPGQAPPSAPYGSPQKLCGKVHNETYNITDTVIMTLDPGGGFSGQLNIGASLYGSGPFRGSSQSGQCSGSTGQLQFQGTCSADRASLRYTINGQTGTMDLSAGACPGGAAPRQGYSPAPQYPPRAPPAPPTPPTPANAPKLCGRIHNETYNLSDSVIMTVGQSGFSGQLNIGASLFGSGPYQGSRQGAQCQGSTGQLQFQGTCTATHFTGRYTIQGQTGTMDLDAANCP